MPTQAELVSIVAEIAEDEVAVRAARTLLQDRGSPTAPALAHELGLPSRFALARRLRRSRALPFVELRAWVVVHHALQAFESDGATPCKVLLTAGKDPAGFYRLVRRLTGRSWTDVCKLGSAWFLGRFAERCREHYAEVR
ncbi:MAG: hypothetical protein PVF27_04080 [Gemmatimonadales bacterium]|jgi:hypothetical protein